MSRLSSRVILMLSAVVVGLSCALPGAIPPRPTPPSTNIIQPTNYVQPLHNVTRTPIEAEGYDIIVVTTTPELDIIMPEDSVVYTVEQGDSFHNLALKFCGDSHLYKRLLALNSMQEGDILEVGQEVVISCG